MIKTLEELAKAIEDARKERNDNQFEVIQQLQAEAELLCKLMACEDRWSYVTDLVYTELEKYFEMPNSDHSFKRRYVKTLCFKVAYRHVRRDIDFGDKDEKRFAIAADPCARKFLRKILPTYLSSLKEKKD